MLTLDDVRAAAGRVAGAVRRTPLVGLEGTPLVAKCENLQRTGSFKIRGATNAVRALAPRAVVAASSGNHGRALAAAAADAGIPCTVVVPADATAAKRAAVAKLGATVVTCAPGFAAREATVAELRAREPALTEIHPYDEPLVMAGQGTVGGEIVEDAAAAGVELAAVVVPLGGGGLLSGVATAVGALAPGVRLVGVEPATGDDHVRSRAAGRRVRIDPPATLADGARAETPGTHTWPVIERQVDDLVAVPDDALVDAVRLLAGCGLVAEPTGALAVAGARHLGLGPGTVCVVSGRNVAPADLARLLA